ncbi:MAG: hypothetical protein ACRCX4_06405 [Bacteroidales bacterium]
MGTWTTWRTMRTMEDSAKCMKDNSDAVSGSRLCLGSTIRQVVPDSFLKESLFVSVRGCFFKQLVVENHRI